jgi:hypothetical protein
MSGSIIYVHERFADMLPELQELLPLHYDELSITKEHWPLAPRFDLYMEMEGVGVLHVVTARDEGRLVGYVIAMVLPNLHYSDCMMAVEDVYYLLPEYRRGRTGIKLFQAFEARMKEVGANRIVITTKVHLDHTRLLEYLGYRFFEKGFTKVI